MQTTEQFTAVTCQAIQYTNWGNVLVYFVENPDSNKLDQ